MASKTIKIWPIGENTTSEEIKNALGEATVVRVHVGKTEAYVEFDSEDGVDVMEFTHPEGKIENLDGANFEKVDSSFKWDKMSSDSSSLQQLKQQREHFDKVEQNITSLTQPHAQNLITISNCDFGILNSMGQAEIKRTVFGAFKSINRVLKVGNRVVIELQDAAETERLQAEFPELRITKLGANAHVDLEAQNQNNFANLWIQQHNKEAQQLQQQSSGKKEQTEEKVLHQEIFPKLNKMTSMETDFLSSQKTQEININSQFTDIAQQSSQHLHTRNELPHHNDNNTQQFVMGEQIIRNPNQELIGGNYEIVSSFANSNNQGFQKQEGDLPIGEQDLIGANYDIVSSFANSNNQGFQKQEGDLPIGQELIGANYDIVSSFANNNQGFQKQEGDLPIGEQELIGANYDIVSSFAKEEQMKAELKKREEQHKRKQEQELKAKQLEEQNKRQKHRIQLQKQQMHQRQLEEQLKKQHELEEQHRQQKQKERLDKERQDKQRGEKERMDKERLQKQRAQKQKHDKQMQEKQRLQKQRLQKQHQEKEKREKELQEKLRFEKQQIERAAKEQAERVAAGAKSAAFVIGQQLHNAKDNLESFVAGENGSRLEERMKAQSRTPVLFWSLVLVTMLALLVI